MKPHKHQVLIKAWADGEPIQYMHRTKSEWLHTCTPNWAVDTEYRIKPNERHASILDGIATLEDGTTINLKWIQGLLNEAFVAHGHPDFAKGANEVAYLTGMLQGPHEEWYVATEEESE